MKESGVGMAISHSYNTYTQAQNRTDDPQKVVVLLYEGIITYLNKARAEIEMKHFIPAHEYFMKAKSIVVELMCALDMEQGGEIAQNLYNLYWFLFEKIIESDYTKDVAIIDAIVPVIRTIKSGWEGMEIDREERMRYKSAVVGLNVKG